MYKLVITSGSWPNRKVESKSYWMTQVGLHEAEEKFELYKTCHDVVELRLWRQDIHGTFELKRWKRHGQD